MKKFWSFYDTCRKLRSFEVLSHYLQYTLEVLQVLWWRSFDRFMTLSGIRHPSPATRHLLPVTRYPPPATRHPLPATHYPLPATRYPLPATCYPLPATRGKVLPPYWCTTDVHQHGVSILGSVNFCETFRRISQVWENAQTLNLEKWLISLSFIT